MATVAEVKKAARVLEMTVTSLQSARDHKEAVREARAVLSAVTEAVEVRKTARPGKWLDSLNHMLGWAERTVEARLTI